MRIHDDWNVFDNHGRPWPQSLPSALLALFLALLMASVSWLLTASNCKSRTAPHLCQSSAVGAPRCCRDTVENPRRMTQVATTGMV